MIEESTQFHRLRMLIGAHRRVDLPWEPGQFGYTTENAGGIEIIVKPIKGKSFVIDFVYVNPEHRRKGLAKTKLKELLKYVDQLKMTCYVFVAPDNAVKWVGEPEETPHPTHEQVTRFYNKLGFKATHGSWMIYHGEEHGPAEYNKFSYPHRHPTKISNYFELKQGLKTGRFKKPGIYTTGDKTWKVEADGTIKPVVGGSKPSFDWHRMRYNVTTEAVDFAPSISYLSIGHHSGLVYLWYYQEGRGLEIQKLENSNLNHGDFWKFHPKGWSGRFDPKTKLLSVAIPNNPPNDWEEILEHELLPKLEEKFNFEHYHVYKW
jgi:GNAT superfamily N-acetyltransferase